MLRASLEPAVTFTAALASIELDEELICDCYEILKIRQIVWRRGNASEQSGEDLRLIPVPQRVELLEDSWRPAS